MNNMDNNYLPHLENAVPSAAHGNRLSMYLIALEAWRRGLTVKFFTIDNPENKLLVRYSLSNQEKEYRFESSRGSKLTDKAFEISDNKDLTKKVISKAGVNVPEGKRFEASIDDSEIVAYANALGYPLVLKPISENAGKGVFSDIKTEEQLKEALVHVRSDLNYHDVIVEKYIPGIEYRILVVDGEVIGAVNRIPANVVGNGKNSIEELIKMKNKEKKNNPNLSKKTIKIDKEVLDSIQSLGYELETILEDGERIYLRSKSNASTGGDPIDVTNELTDELISIATKSFHAIPGLDVCGLDMIVDKENNTGAVIEINTKPMLGLHVFPMRGEARDVVKPIIDYYFPETINTKKTNLYFDFDSILAPFISRSINEVVLPAPPSLEEQYAKRYIVSGNISVVGYKSWVRKKALRNKLHGYIKDLKDGTTEIVIAGSNKTEVEQFKDICYEGPEEAEVMEVEEYNWEKPVKTGFEILRESRTELLNKLENEKDENNKLLQQKEKMKRKTKKKEERLKQDKAKAKQRIKDIEKEKEKVQQNEEEIKNEKVKLQAEKEKLLKEIEELVEEREVLRQNDIMIKNSHSWRITKPLRDLSGYLKRIKS
ncbi:acylphosphatase [Virgibacillus sp. CBA3643]|uniref:acylphosphatase n=1 Tax=Virgibacillus sp. CBA3643 TaxID=2942278 RepID=UPI0035A3A9F9